MYLECRAAVQDLRFKVSGLGLKGDSVKGKKKRLQLRVQALAFLPSHIFKHCVSESFKLLLGCSVVFFSTSSVSGSPPMLQQLPTAS